MLKNLQNIIKIYQKEQLRCQWLLTSMDLQLINLG